MMAGSVLAWQFLFLLLLLLLLFFIYLLLLFFFCNLRWTIVLKLWLLKISIAQSAACLIADSRVEFESQLGHITSVEIDRERKTFLRHFPSISAESRSVVVRYWRKRVLKYQLTSQRTCKPVLEECEYSITSVARTRMARLPWMIRTLFSVPIKFFPIAQENKYLGICLIFYHGIVCCVYSLESPHRGDSNEYTQHTIVV